MRTSDDQSRLDRLRDYFAEHRVMPSFAKAAEVLGYRSTSAVSALVDRLTKQQFLSTTEHGRLLPGRRFFERIVSDSRVPAGKPTMGVDLGGSPTIIDEELVRHPSRSLLVRVEGDSMADAGLMSGDTVVVERNSVAEIGAIVVAHVDGELTIKHLRRDRQGYYLRAANPRYEDIRPKNDLEIVGVVVGMYRRIN